MAQDYVAAFARDGSRRFIANLDTRVDLFSWGDHVLPVTVNDGETPGTFVWGSDGLDIPHLALC